MRTSLGDLPSRSDVLEFLFEASRYGNLGLFIGAGFSKALFASDEENIALSWGDLLKAASKKMGMSFSKFNRAGRSYPEVASALCAAHAKKTGGSFAVSLSMLKRALSESTAWYPHEPERSKYSSYLRELAPAWIITTNYDQILECLLPGTSVSLGPNDSFLSRKGITPIFHLHGVRTHPEELIIAQEDYVALFRPQEYRQIRLALAMKESTACLLGYGLGDVNVLTALDWSKNVYEEGDGAYPHEVIQVLRQKNPETEPYRLGNRILVVEVSEISSFFDEYAEAIDGLQAVQRKQGRRRAQIAKIFKEAKPENVNRFIEDEEWRRKVLQTFAKNSVQFVAEFEIFLVKTLKETRKRSGKPGAFNVYATNLDIILDFLNAFESEHFPPALLAAVVHNFDRLALYIGDDFGSSWAAKGVWDNRKSELRKSTIAELRVIAQQYGYATLKRLLDDL